LGEIAVEISIIAKHVQVLTTLRASSSESLRFDLFQCAAFGFRYVERHKNCPLKADRAVAGERP
jgi:hypothetical protein